MAGLPEGGNFVTYSKTSFRVAGMIELRYKRGMTSYD